MEAGGERGEEGYREHMAERRKSERERSRKKKEERAAGEMIMIGATNGGVYIYSTEESTGGVKGGVY